MKLVGWTSMWAVLMVGTAFAQVGVVVDGPDEPVAPGNEEAPAEEAAYAETAPMKKVEVPADMPEMLVGYTPGYRNSSTSFMGATGNEVINLNPWAWSGDHSMARDLVPGTLFSSRRVSAKNPNIIDLPVTILDWFGIERPSQMEGSSIFRP